MQANTTSVSAGDYPYCYTTRRSMYSNFLLISAVLLAHVACTTARTVPELPLLLPSTLRSTSPPIYSALSNRVHISGIFGSIGGERR